MTNWWKLALWMQLTMLFMIKLVLLMLMLSKQAMAHSVAPTRQLRQPSMVTQPASKTSMMLLRTTKILTRTRRSLAITSQVRSTPSRVRSRLFRTSWMLPTLLTSQTRMASSSDLILLLWQMQTRAILLQRLLLMQTSLNGKHTTSLVLISTTLRRNSQILRLALMPKWLRWSLRMASSLLLTASLRRASLMLSLLSAMKPEQTMQWQLLTRRLLKPSSQQLSLEQISSRVQPLSLTISTPSRQQLRLLSTNTKKSQVLSLISMMKLTVSQRLTKTAMWWRRMVLFSTPSSLGQRLLPMKQWLPMVRCQRKNLLSVKPRRLSKTTLLKHRMLWIRLWMPRLRKKTSLMLWKALLIWKLLWKLQLARFMTWRLSTKPMKIRS